MLQFPPPHVFQKFLLNSKEKFAPTFASEAFLKPALPCKAQPIPFDCHRACWIIQILMWEQQKASSNVEADHWSGMLAGKQPAPHWPYSSEVRTHHGVRTEVWGPALMPVRHKTTSVHQGLWCFTKPIQTTSRLETTSCLLSLVKIIVSPDQRGFTRTDWRSRLQVSPSRMAFSSYKRAVDLHFPRHKGDESL